MSDLFETIDLNVAEEQLRIDISPGHIWEGVDYKPSTDFHITPPLTEDEHNALLEAHGSDFKLGKTLETDVDTEVKSVPEYAIELAEAIITLRGLKAAKVVSTVGEVVHSYLIRQKTEAEVAGEDEIVIDANEFKQARVSPETKSRMKQALEYNETQKNRDIRLLETSPVSAVLRMPTGKLIGISLDTGPEGQEELNLTELESEQVPNGFADPHAEA